MRFVPAGGHCVFISGHVTSVAQAAAARASAFRRRSHWYKQGGRSSSKEASITSRSHGAGCAASAAAAAARGSSVCRLRGGATCRAIADSICARSSMATSDCSFLSGVFRMYASMPPALSMSLQPQRAGRQDGSVGQVISECGGMAGGGAVAWDASVAWAMETGNKKGQEPEP